MKTIEEIAKHEGLIFESSMIEPSNELIVSTYNDERKIISFVSAKKNYVAKEQFEKSIYALNRAPLPSRWNICHGEVFETESLYEFVVYR